MEIKKAKSLMDVGLRYVLCTMKDGSQWTYDPYGSEVKYRWQKVRPIMKELKDSLKEFESLAL